MVRVVSWILAVNTVENEEKLWKLRDELTENGIVLLTQLTVCCKFHSSCRKLQISKAFIWPYPGMGDILVSRTFRKHFSVH